MKKAVKILCLSLVISALVSVFSLSAFAVSNYSMTTSSSTRGAKAYLTTPNYNRVKYDFTLNFMGSQTSSSSATLQCYRYRVTYTQEVPSALKFYGSGRHNATWENCAEDTYLLGLTAHFNGRVVSTSGEFYGQ